MIIEKIDALIRKIVMSKNWDIQAAIIIFILIHFVSFPSYNLQYENWSDQYEKSSKVLSNMEFGSEFSHKAKINVRITVPILIKIFNLSPLGLILLKSLVGLIFIYLILRMFCLILEDKYLAMLLTISCAFVGFGKAAILEQRQIFDGLSLTLALASFLTRSSFIALLCLISGFFNDERTLITVFLFTLYFYQFNNQLNRKRDTKYPHMVLISFILFISIRLFMQVKLGIESPFGGVGLTTFLNQINAVSIGYFMFLEGFWIIVLYSLYLLLNSKQNKPLIIFTWISFLLGSLSSFLVIDHGRSILYSYPIIFFGISYLKKTINVEKLRTIIIATLISCILIPTIGFGGKKSFWSFYSLPTQVIRILLDRY